MCCSKLGDIYVALALLGVGEQKIARYHGQKLLQDIEKDEDGNKIFKDGFWPLYITENNNGDICVSDPNARKVVSDTTGKLSDIIGIIIINSVQVK